MCVSSDGLGRVCARPRRTCEKRVSLRASLRLPARASAAPRYRADESLSANAAVRRAEE